MPLRKRKYTKKTPKFRFTNEHKKYVAITFFVFFGVLAIIADIKSTIWYQIYNILGELFWEYYKIIFSPVAILLSVFLIKDRGLQFNFYRLIGLFIYLSSLTTLVGFFDDSYYWLFNYYKIAEDLLWRWATWFTFTVLLLLSLTILFRFNPITFLETLFSFRPSLWSLKDTFKSEMGWSNTSTRKEKKMDKKQRELDDLMIKLKNEKKLLAKSKQSNQLNLTDAPKKIKIEKKKPSKIWWIFTKSKPEKEVKIVRNPEFKNWHFPELSLLKDNSTNVKIDPGEVRRKEIEIQEKLLQFRIEVSMEWYEVGPTVIQYRLKPKRWVKLQKIVNLKKDLALALHAKSIRIQAPIPGLGVVGIEVPNSSREIIWLKEILSTRQFNARNNEIPIALGKNVSWKIIIWDLAAMPHILVAWQTGSGKSVWMNAFLISMLYKFSPSELKMIMVDPKRVELSVYNWIPHLLTPVITNPDKALNALKWCVAEMLRRYDMAMKAKARNLQEYNKKQTKKADRLPYIVMVIDELADLMMSWNKKEVEQLISRITQMARAVWIHLIVATQRPSVDVVTWLIKANIPSRIAFTVASGVDSKTIIWKWWAEELLWKWDMLYHPTWAIAPERVQWVFVETSEVEAVVNKLKLTVDPDMLDNMQISEITEWKSKLAWSVLEDYKGDQDEDPEIIERAIQVVKEAKKWSTSLVQRKLSLWYARAAKVLDILEELGVVGPPNGSKPREVYVE